MNTSTCPICSTTFHHYGSQPRTYCSKPCQYKATAARKTKTDARVTTNCPGCGKAFTWYRSWPRKYCSQACSGKTNVVNTGRPTNNRYPVTCEICGTAFETTPAVHARFCSQRCWGRWMSANRTGDQNHNKGKRFGRSLREPNPAIMHCPICLRDFPAKPSHVARRRFCSKECYGKWTSENQVGENSPTWRGGHIPYYGPSWHRAKRAARKRDGVCQDCGAAPKPKKALDVHHLVAFRSFGVERHAEANVLSNLVALCTVCHLNREWATNRRQALTS